MAYPASIDSFSARTDNVDEVVANDVNELQTAVAAIETELGTLPKGTATDLKTRLAKSLDGAGYLQFAPANTLAIASGSITPTQNYHLIDTENAAASDTLSTITAPSTDGYILLIRPVATARNVILEHDNGGNIYCTAGIDVTLETAYDLAILIYDSTLAYWIAFHPTVAGSTDPQVVGSTDWPGTSAKYSAEDHIHRLPIGSGLAWDTDAQLMASGWTTDHGALGGLGDDDHTLYSLANGTRAFSGAITISSANAQDGYVWKAQDSDGLGAWEAEAAGGGGTTDHTALSNIGVNTHAALDAGLVPVCCGRLSLSTDPAPTTDITGATTLYFEPYNGDQISLYDGANWHTRTFTEISLALSAYSASDNVDIFAYDDSGTPALAGIKWTNDNTRAAPLDYFNGVLECSTDNTRRYLGTIRMTSTTDCADSEVNRFAWNMYNRIRKPAKVSETTSHTYTSTGRYWNNSLTNNQCSFVIGLNNYAKSTINVIVKAGAVAESADVYLMIDGTIQWITCFSRNTGYAGSSQSNNMYYTAGYHYTNAWEVGDVSTSTFYRMDMVVDWEC